MIDERLLINYLENWKQALDASYQDELVGTVLDIILKKIQRFPNIKKDEWIPIGQYPTEPCLLCLETGQMFVGYYDYLYHEWCVCIAEDFETNFTEDDLEDGEPVAWMPLPEAYKPPAAAGGD